MEETVQSITMLNSCPTQEAVEYLRVEWKKYEMKCRDIEVGTTILMELDPTMVERIMAGVEEQSKEYSKLSNNMGRILTNLTRNQHDNPQPQRQKDPDKEPKIKKELCPDSSPRLSNCRGLRHNLSSWSRSDQRSARLAHLSR